MMLTLIGGLTISLLGAIMLGSTRPIVRMAVRNHTVVEQIGGNVTTWLARGVGTVLIILGLVTMIVR
ncbi:hypothetical protein CVU37_03695 [candidate division BRC1 bacterium HGW-BRC1-1]|jgi:hypothetical protein|nr:MAG: hypothetical protein CVU37_03695 [candidate division BRC1 bacterium HGW-BRC1-1]